MRWLFLGLIIINAFYFLWNHQAIGSSEQALQGVRGQKPAYSGQVKLLSEAVDLESKAMQEDFKKSEVMLLGGFSDNYQAQRLQQRLLSLDIDSQVTEIDSKVDIEYWVYLQPLPSRQAAVRQLKELQARKIDGYLITTGELNNGVSLGMFAREDSAQGVAERMSAAGYEPSIKSVERSQRLYWVVIESSARRLVDQALLKQLVEDFAGMQHLFMPYEKLRL
ncbi:SPOR domain-containing protein [Pseudomonas sp. C27(2019)]|uniref:SPOR domain-containing protein n=1 Tax=Pseudomonas sp. C27(2019) TaxID=2604941 RepID=UPI00124910BB|nr:SPOR domain-containing protein [Pseudomonas sp. C27(2019)]QEY59823.1 SPOR domain-containing protein [Pseudomonas sp. C27(2019)]